MLAKVPLHGQNTDPKRVHGRNGIRVSVKARLVKSFQKRILNPFVKALVRRGAVDGWAIIETRGRKTGAPRETPVGNGLEGDTFWLVAEFGRAAAYVKNIEADPGCASASAGCGVPGARSCSRTTTPGFDRRHCTA
jgi:hypothetical protein